MNDKVSLDKDWDTKRTPLLDIKDVMNSLKNDYPKTTPVVDSNASFPEEAGLDPIIIPRDVNPLTLDLKWDDYINSRYEGTNPFTVEILYGELKIIYKSPNIHATEAQTHTHIFTKKAWAREEWFVKEASEVLSEEIKEMLGDEITPAEICLHLASKVLGVNE